MTGWPFLVLACIAAAAGVIGGIAFQALVFCS